MTVAKAAFRSDVITWLRAHVYGAGARTEKTRSLIIFIFCKLYISVMLHDLVTCQNSPLQ